MHKFVAVETLVIISDDRINSSDDQELSKALDNFERNNLGKFFFF